MAFRLKKYATKSAPYACAACHEAFQPLFRRPQDCQEYRQEAERARAQAAELEHMAEAVAEEIAGLRQEVERLRLNDAELREEILRKEKARSCAAL